MDDATAPPRLVWCDATGSGRQVAVLFRRSLAIRGAVRTARLAIFADARYRLRVNDAVVAYGPARFVPEHPEHDEVDLAPHLRAGGNAITVEVLSVGTETFETTPASSGAFIAWGQVEHDGADISLATPGDWRQRRLPWDACAPRASFGQAAIEAVDLRALDPAWFLPVPEDEGWSAPVERSRGHPHGACQERSIPYLTNEELPPPRLALAARLAQDEQVLSACVFQAWPHFALPAVPSRFCYATWLHSAVDQEVELGLFWGPHHLNGVELACSNDTLRGNRQNATARLTRGWNLLYGEPQIMTESWTLLIGLPVAAGLSARAEPDLACPHALRHTDPIDAPELDRLRRSPPADEAALRALALSWHLVAAGDLAGSPARRCAWDRIGAVIAADDAPQLRLDFAQASAYALVLDAGREYLGHAIVDIEAPPGTVIDIAYDERRRDDGLLAIFQTNPFVENVDRFIARGGRQRIEVFSVRGGRFLQVIVRGGSAAALAIVHAVGVRSGLLPLALQGDFACSDPDLDATWRMCRGTFEVCTTDSYVPDVWRERGLAVADNRLQGLMHRALGSDLGLARRCLLLFAAGQGSADVASLEEYMPSMPLAQTPLLDFTLLWIVWLHDYWAMTGDVDAVRACWPTVERIWASSAWHSSRSILWDVADGERIFIDWGMPRSDKRGAEHGALNAIRHRALVASAVSSPRRSAAALPASASAARPRRCGRRSGSACGTASSAASAPQPTPHRPPARAACMSTSSPSPAAWSMARMPSASSTGSPPSCRTTASTDAGHRTGRANTWSCRSCTTRSRRSTGMAARRWPRASCATTGATSCMRAPRRPGKASLAVARAATSGARIPSSI